MAIDQAAPREADEAAGLGGALPRRSPRTSAAPREEGAPDPDAAVPGRVIDGLRSV
jgi:hypothetical protein